MTESWQENSYTISAFPLMVLVQVLAYTYSRGVFIFDAVIFTLKIAPGTWRGDAIAERMAFLDAMADHCKSFRIRCEDIMETGNKITKQQEREVMLEMLIVRESRRSCHSDPIWVHEFWSKRQVEHSEIKRVLGVGMAKLSDHLRLYKDPFETC
jgi:hypothetical protein